MSASIIPTGFPTLDKSLSGGLRAGSLTLVAGRSGMGKTSFMKQMQYLSCHGFIQIMRKADATIVASAAKIVFNIGGILFLDNDKGLPDITGKKLKELAQEYQIPIVVATGVSRDCEKREDKHPRLSDLSPDLVNAADLVLALYRDSYYHCEDPENTKADVLLLKNVWGKTRKIPMSFDPLTRCWSDPPIIKKKK